MKFPSKIVMQKSASELVSVNDVTRISAGTSIVGDLVSQSDIRIDGAVKGKICSGGRVVVGEAAKITGTLMCGSLDLWGKVDGDVYVRDTVSMMENSSVHGSLNTSRLQVEIGAAIDGSCHMITEAEFEAKRSLLFAPAAKPAVAAKPAAKPAAPAAKPAAAAPDKPAA